MLYFSKFARLGNRSRLAMKRTGRGRSKSQKRSKNIAVWGYFSHATEIRLKKGDTMRRLPKIETKQQQQIYKLLQLFSRYSNTGLLPFFGVCTLPEDEALFLMRQAQYIDDYKARHHGATPEIIPTKGGSRAPYAQKVVEVADSVKEQIRQAGGLDTFKAAFEELTKTQPRNMQILIDLSRRAATLDTVETISEKHRYSSAGSIYRIRDRLLTALAINISGRAISELSKC